MNLRIYLTEQQQYLDLGNTPIQFNNSIKNVQEIGVNGAEFSTSFSVDATKKNNSILNHYYRNDIVGGLDARQFIKCKVIHKGKTIKDGGLVIESAKMDKGKCISYELRFFDHVVDFKTKIAQDSLRELELTSSNTKATSALSLFQDTSGGLFRDIEYPLGSTKNRLVYDSTSIDNTQLPKTKNICKLLLNASTTNDDPRYYAMGAEDITPAMRVGKIIDLIEDKYNITINGVLKQDFVQDLYLWLNRPEKGTDFRYGWSQGMTSLDGTFDWGSFNNAVFGNIVVDAPTEDYYFTVKMEDTGVTGATQQLLVDGKVVGALAQGSGTTSETKLLKESLITTESYAKTTVGISCSPTVTISRYNSDGTLDSTHRFNSNNSVLSDVSIVVKDRMPNIKVIDFFTNLFKMFNIVSEFEDNVLNTYLYDPWVESGTTIDLSSYINGTAEVMPVNKASTINFSFEEGGTAIETAYKQVNARNYGELYYSSNTLEGQRSVGKGEEIKVKSQSMPLEKLLDIRGNQFTDVVAAQWVDLDGNTKGDKPCFTYVVRGTQNIAFRNASGTISTVSQYRMPSNIYSPTTNQPRPTTVTRAGYLGLYFGQELNEHDTNFNFENNGLYNWFYRGYIAKVWDTDNRLVKLTVKNPRLIEEIKLNDKILINNQYYLINSMNYKPSLYETDFELIAVGSKIPEEFTSKTETIVKPSGTVNHAVAYVDTNGVLQYQVSTGAITITSIGGVKAYKAV